MVEATESGEHAYLCDFGLAKHLSSVSSLTGERAFVGTIAYISPEQIEGATIDARADVYSLGCMLFECLTGQAPFERASEVATVYAHMNEPPPRPSEERPGTPAGFDDVIARALAKAPDDRYASCGELARASEAALRGELPGRSRRRRRLALGALAAAVAVAVAATAGIVLHDDGGGGTAAPAKLAIAPKTMGLIDATTHKVVGQIPLAGQPWDVAFDKRQAWVMLGDERRIARVDLTSHKVLSSTKLPFRPGGITTGAGAAWVTEADGPGLVRLDGKTGTVAKRYSVQIRSDRRSSSTGIAYGAGSVWVARGPETVRVDPVGGNVMKRILTPLAATSVVFADGAVWVASAENGRVMKIDPAINGISASTQLHATITDLAVGNGSVWVSIVPDNVIYRLSPDDGSRARDASRRAVAGITLGRRRPLGRRCQGQADRTHQRRRAAPDAAAFGAAVGGPLPRRSAVGLRGRAAADRHRRHGPDAQDSARKRRLQHRERGPCDQRRPGLPAARLRDLSVSPQLSRRSGCRRPRAPARGCGRASPRLARRTDVDIPHPSRVPVLSAVRPGRHRRDLQGHHRAGVVAEAHGAGRAAESECPADSHDRRRHGVRGRSRGAHHAASRPAETRSRSA